MKILCDVCGKGEASFYCAADEASLCAACDHRVHHANKLAGKHHRFSLRQPSPKQTPLCDICQERKAFLFCQQDRAILCSGCDAAIHKTNQLTQRHTRFILTGVTLSSTSEEPAAAAACSGGAPKNKTAPTCTTPTAKGTTPTEAAQDPSQFSTSSISEYLIETLPGWHVEDLLDSSSPSTCCKSEENDLALRFWDADLENGFPTENMGFWVPQNQSFLDNNYNYNVGFGLANGGKDQLKEFSTNGMKSTRKRSEDNSFAVPQITPPSAAASKRSRTFW